MMKKLFALLVAGFVASAAFAQEAPDVLVQRVTEEVLEIIRNDRKSRTAAPTRSLTWWTRRFCRISIFST
jgi:phospholipid transport system substrate-binding protein